jgi:hypothetical protein
MSEPGKILAWRPYGVKSPDEAWGRGYEAATRDVKRWLGLTLLVGVVDIMLRRKFHPLVVVAVVLTAGTVLVVAMAIYAVARLLLVAYRHHPKVHLTKVDMGDGTTF